MMFPPKVSRSTICGAEPRVGERLGPAGEGLVAGDRDAVGLLAFREDLEQQLGAAPDEIPGRLGARLAEPRDKPLRLDEHVRGSASTSVALPINHLSAELGLLVVDRPEQPLRVP